MNGVKFPENRKITDALNRCLLIGGRETRSFSQTSMFRPKYCMTKWTEPVTMNEIWLRAEYFRTDLGTSTNRGWRVFVKRLLAAESYEHGVRTEICGYGVYKLLFLTSRTLCSCCERFDKGRCLCYLEYTNSMLLSNFHKFLSYFMTSYSRWHYKLSYRRSENLMSQVPESIQHLSCDRNVY